MKPVLPAMAYGALMMLVLGAEPATAPRPESHYRDRLAAVLDGKAETRLSDGTRCDVLTDDLAIEVDFGHRMYNAVGQSLHYAAVTGCEPAIYLVVRDDADARWAPRCRRLCDKFGIILFVVDER